jgi:hypothetical protein
MKKKAGGSAQDWIAEFDCRDVKELLELWELPYATPVRPTASSVRGAFEDGGYRVLWFVWEERPKGTVCEIGLERITAPHCEDESQLVDHLRKILRQARVEVRPEHMVVRRDSDHPSRMDVGFVDFARRK